MSWAESVLSVWQWGKEGIGNQYDIHLRWRIRQTGPILNILHWIVASCILRCANDSFPLQTSVPWLSRPIKLSSSVCFNSNHQLHNRVHSFTYGSYFCSRQNSRAVWSPGHRYALPLPRLVVTFTQNCRPGSLWCTQSCRPGCDSGAEKSLWSGK